jgi:nitrite reductase (cytochrome c-552)
MARPKKENRLASAALLTGITLVLLFGIHLIISQVEDIIRAEAWVDQHPDQYRTYLMNEEMVRTTFGGSEPIDYLEKYPELLTIYDGVGFSVEYLRARGHVYALEDVVHTERSKPGASCLACKTPDYVAMETEHGYGFYAMDFDEMAAQAHSGVSCYDCHRNEPGVLHITRGHLQKGLSFLEEEFQMKNLICAQCHIEYYLHPETKEVTVPWKYGTDVAQIEATFVEWNFIDWTHPQTEGGLYKIQHPEFETFRGSIHDSFGITCVDCHMPRITNDAGETFPSHHWTSPLKTVEASCLNCHAEARDELVSEVERLQGIVEEKTIDVSRQLVVLINAISAAKDDLPEAVLEEVYQLHRSAQVRWDFVFVENSQGFHHYAKAMAYLNEAEAMITEALELLP